jgi:PhnB protein
MGSILNPYISFDGEAREAMEFYQSVLGGKLELSTFGESGVPDAPPDQIMHAQLTSDAGYMLMASDTPPGCRTGPVRTSRSVSAATTRTGCAGTSRA